MLTTSPYHSVAANLRENGYHVMPVGPGTKVPGQIKDGEWRPMGGWQKYCDTLPPEFIHDQWERMQDAGVCVAHGNVIGLDLDTDRKDVEAALHAAVEPSDVRRRGRKGWMGYYRPGDGLDGLTARVRWYDPKVMGADGKPSRSPVVELMMHGTQSLVPPSIHPDTGEPYRWVGIATLEDTVLDELPIFTGHDLAALDREFGRIGLTREVPRAAELREFITTPSDMHDLEKPWGRSVNDRAMEPGAIDQWWPALNLPKTKQTGHGAWRGVPDWRPSGSGRAMEERNPNIGITPQGIRDFAREESYTPLSLVVAARGCSVAEAGDWLGQFIRAESGAALSDAIADVMALEPKPAIKAPAVIDVEPEPEPSKRRALSALRRMLDRGAGSRKPVKKIQPSNLRDYSEAFPDEPVPFPVQDFERDLSGLLRDLTLRIDAGSRMRSEQGAFGAALSLMSVALGGKIELPQTGLRSNLYVVGTATSGAGKSSALSAMKKVAVEVGIMDRIGGSDFTSGSAILKELGGGASNKLFCVDEFGDVMKRILGAKSASHEQDIRRIMKDIYSAGDSVYQGKSKASEERVDIPNPHMCLYGISTFEAFWEGLDGASFRDGLIARFLSVPIGNTEVQRPRDVLRDEVCEAFDMMLQSKAQGGNLSDRTARPVLVHSGLYARYEADWEMNQRHSERAKLMGVIGGPSIIMRISEMAMKIAMISAAGRVTGDDVTMIEDDYDLGMAVAHWSAINMIQAIRKYYIESEAHRNVKRIIEIVDDAGKDGASKRDIYRKTQGMTPRERDDAIKTASESGDITYVEVKTAGRPKNVYYSSAALKEMANGEKNDK